MLNRHPMSKYLANVALMCAAPFCLAEIPRSGNGFAGDQAIRNYDFLNATYASPIADHGVQVKDGEGSTGVSAYSVRVSFGDLDGDAREEAVVLWQDEGAVGASSGAQLYRVSDGKLTEWIPIEGGARNDGFLTLAKIEQGELILARGPMRTFESEPCDGFTVSVQALEDNALVERQTYCDDLSDPLSHVARANWPEDLSRFVQSRQMCDHFRGEPIEGDSAEMKERQEFVLQKIEETCTGTDAELKRLREAHAGNPDITRALEIFEDTIESPGDEAPAGPSLETGVYGSITIGTDYDQGQFSGVLQLDDQPECGLRFRGLLQFGQEPMQATAQLRSHALVSPDATDTNFPMTIRAGADAFGTPTIEVAIETVPNRCTALATWLKARATPLVRTQAGEWKTVHWIQSDRAYFHSEAHDSTRGKAYVVLGDTVRGYGVTAAFLEAEYVGKTGRTTRGWINWMDVLPELWLGDGAEM